MSPRTVQRAIRLLEVLGLVEVATCYEQGGNRQTSNLYTLLTPPQTAPAIDPDPVAWPEPRCRTLLVRAGNRAQAVADAREQERLEIVQEGTTPRQADAPSPVTLTRPPRHGDALPHDTVAGQEGDTSEGDPVKDPACPLATSFVIAEVGLSSRQVWAAALEHLARWGEIGRGDLDTWLRPAALIGRDGATLIVGAPNGVTRERIATRLLPVLRAGLAAAVGAPVEVAVTVAGDAERRAAS